MGAKGKYQEYLTEDGLLLLEGWARDGLTDEQISNNIGIRAGTLYEWQNKYPEISEALKKGKAPVDYEVENALKKKATGYYVTVKKPIKVKTKRTLKDKGTIEEEHIEYVDDQIYIPPDTTAQIFWLKNRKPDRWRDKQVVETDTTALDKLDAILRESRENADKESSLEYITEDDIQQETE